MGLEKIIAISGKPGLYELVSQTRGGFVVTSLIDGKKQSKFNILMRILKNTQKRIRG